MPTEITKERIQELRRKVEAGGTRPQDADLPADEARDMQRLRWFQDMPPELVGQFLDLLDERERLVTALKFYANDQGYWYSPEEAGQGVVTRDCGSKARAALAQIKE